MFEAIGDCGGHCTLSGLIGHPAGLLDDCILISSSHLGMISQVMSLMIGSVTQFRS